MAGGKEPVEGRVQETAPMEEEMENVIASRGLSVPKMRLKVNWKVQQSAVKVVLKCL